MVARIGTKALYSLNFSGVFKTLGNVATLQTQAASGKVGQRYDVLGEKSEQLVNLEVRLDRGNQYIDNIVTVQSRLNKMEVSYNQLQDVASEWKTKLVAALSNGSHANMNLGVEAGDALNTITSLLNTKDNDGRYVFAGTKTDTAPVDLSAFTTPVNIAVANTEYYQGDANTASFQADLNLSFDYGEKADNTTFEKLIRALRAIQGGGGNNEATLNSALDLFDTVISELGTKLGALGSLDKSLDRIRESHSDSLQLIGENINDLENVDVTEVLSRLSEQQTLLQASLTVVTRLNQISLVNYLQ